MKKSFLFASAAVLATLASCSSDDALVQEAPQAPGQENVEEGLVPISIGVTASSTNAGTRGTGAVGQVGTGSDSKWDGQTVNVLMFEREYATGSTTKYVSTLRMAKSADGTTVLYPLDGNTLKTPAGYNTGEATSYPTKDNSSIRYYPSTGRFDFWGYRLDDASNGPVLNGDAYIADIEINGTQDIMTALAPTDQAISNVEPGYLYSAYAARRDVQPILKFKHKLSRFTFDVLAGNDEAIYHKTETVENENPTIYYKHTDSEGNVTYDEVEAGSEGSYYRSKYNNDIYVRTLDPNVNFTPQDGTNDNLWKKNSFVGGVYHDANETSGIEIQSIEIISKYAGTIAVAYIDEDNSNAGTYDGDDKQTAYFEDVEALDGVDADAKAQFRALEADGITDDRKAIFTLKQRGTDKTEADNLVELVPVGPSSKTEAKGVGESLIVAPGEKEYYIRVSIKQSLPSEYFYDENGNMIGKYKLTTHSSSSYFAINHDAKDSDNNATIKDQQDVFTDGYSYKVTLKMYSLEEIEIKTTVEDWKDGGFVDVDEEQI